MLDLVPAPAPVRAPLEVPGLGPGQARARARGRPATEEGVEVPPQQVRGQVVEVEVEAEAGPPKREPAQWPTVAGAVVMMTEVQ